MKKSSIIAALIGVIFLSGCFYDKSEENSSADDVISSESSAVQEEKKPTSKLNYTCDELISPEKVKEITGMDKDTEKSDKPEISGEGTAAGYNFSNRCGYGGETIPNLYVGFYLSCFPEMTRSEMREFMNQYEKMFSGNVEVVENQTGGKTFYDEVTEGSRTVINSAGADLTFLDNEQNCKVTVNGVLPDAGKKVVEIGKEIEKNLK